MRFFRRSEVWVPTWQGWSLILGVPVLAVVMVVALSYPFLNVNRQLGSGYLVVEGWMSKRQIGRAVELFHSADYDSILVTGGPIHSESYLHDLFPNHSTEAEVAAQQMRQFGFKKVVAVPRPDVSRDRTYSSALALRKWLIDRGRYDPSLDVVSVGPHARRSAMLFELALSGVAEVGIIALRPTGYDPERWWTTSSGVRSMIGELLAYGYAKFLFWPDPDQDLKTLYTERSGE